MNIQLHSFLNYVSKCVLPTSGPVKNSTLLRNQHFRIERRKSKLHEARD